jgi:hypothetical protein
MSIKGLLPKGSGLEAYKQLYRQLFSVVFPGATPWEYCHWTRYQSEIMEIVEYNYGELLDKLRGIVFALKRLPRGFREDAVAIINEYNSFLATTGTTIDKAFKALAICVAGEELIQKYDDTGFEEQKDRIWALKREVIRLLASRSKNDPFVIHFNELEPLLADLNDVNMLFKTRQNAAEALLEENPKSTESLWVLLEALKAKVYDEQTRLAAEEAELHRRRTINRLLTPTKQKQPSQVRS